jgi:hypothetical protein
LLYNEQAHSCDWPEVRISEFVIFTNNYYGLEKFLFGKKFEAVKVLKGKLLVLNHLEKIVMLEVE